MTDYNSIIDARNRGGTDLVYPTVGTTGPQGPQGLQGATGPAGPQGPQGEMGPANIDGGRSSSFYVAISNLDAGYANETYGGILNSIDGGGA